MKALTVVLMLLFLLPSVAALDSSLTCQYQEKSTVMQLQTFLVDKHGQNVPSPLEAGDVTMKQSGSPCWFSFPVTNKANLRISARYSYKLNVTDEIGTYIHEDTFGVLVDPMGTASVGRSWDDVTACSFINGSIEVKYQDSLDTSVESRKVPVEVWTCSKCNGQDCINDGLESNDPALCGGGLVENGRCAAHCSDGYLNCHDICLPVGTKDAGSTYECDFECQSGRGEDGKCIECTNDDQCTLGVCNLELRKCTEYYNGNFGCNIAGKDYIPCEDSKTCVLPSSKKNGAGYSCETECISGRGVDGVCRMNIKSIIMYAIGVLIFLILVIVIIIIGAKYVHQRIIMREVKAQADIIRTKQESLEKKTLMEIQEAQDRLVKSEKKNQEKLKELRKRAEEEERRIHQRRGEIEKANQKLVDALVEAEAMRRKKYLNKQNYKVMRNENGYEVLIRQDGSEGSLFHRFWAEKQIFGPNREWFKTHFGSDDIWDYEVHHIDSDILNNQEENLAIIPHDLHLKINHRAISRNNREAGLVQLRRLRIKQPHLRDL